MAIYPGEKRGFENVLVDEYVAVWISSIQLSI